MVEPKWLRNTGVKDPRQDDVADREPSETSTSDESCTNSCSSSSGSLESVPQATRDMIVGMLACDIDTESELSSDDDSEMAVHGNTTRFRATVKASHMQVTLSVLSA